MICGTGIDIIEIDRVRQSIAKHGERFLNRLFTPNEQAYCNQFADSAPRYAGRFSAKEAIMKSLGEGSGQGSSWLDIEITNDELGRPLVKLEKAFAERHGQPELHISLSHCQSHATAVCIVNRRGEHE